MGPTCQVHLVLFPVPPISICHYKFTSSFCRLSSFARTDSENRGCHILEGHRRLAIWEGYQCRPWKRGGVFDQYGGGDEQNNDWWRSGNCWCCRNWIQTDFDAEQVEESIEYFASTRKVEKCELTLAHLENLEVVADNGGWEEDKLATLFKVKVAVHLQ